MADEMNTIELSIEALPPALVSAIQAAVDDGTRTALKVGDQRVALVPADEAEMLEDDEDDLFDELAGAVAEAAEELGLADI